LDETAQARQEAQKNEISPRLLAFYLPQFHPTPENNVWWGEGYTEWTNVARARPRFEGHYQPRLPADLGFYDLRLPEVRQAQADIAREHGIHGFCYYHYWFNGRRMLERPFEEVLESGEPDFPFCLAWANHTWTWKRDHSMQARLVEQEYSEEDDREHIRWLLEAFRDERYIRVNGRPLVLLYWVHALPNPERTFEIWREEAAKTGEAEPYICKMDTFGNFDDPRELGCDASVEFWPHRLEKIVPTSQGEEEAYKENKMFEYRQLVIDHLERESPGNFNRYPCIVPSWDNTARWKSDKPIIIHGSTPQLYKAWLEGVIRRTARQFEPEEQLVFINAWNEWGEAAYLEPDLEYGRAYLESTRQALEDSGAELPESDARQVSEGTKPASAEARYQKLRNKYERLQAKFMEWSSLEEQLPLVQKAERRHEELREENLRLSRQNQTIQRRHTAQRNRLTAAENRLAKLSGVEQSKLQHAGSQETDDEHRLTNWLQQLDTGIQALLDSRRWKIGDASGKALDKILRRQETKTAADHLQRVLGEFRAWKGRDGGSNG
jgi:hypothetical protein